MTAYRRGADFERRVRGCLEGEGWLVIRAAGSHGSCDLVALRPALQPGACLVRLVQCKVRGVRDFGPQERAEFVKVAKAAGATAWLASRGKSIGWRLLFAPDELAPWVPSLRACMLLRRESRL